MSAVGTTLIDAPAVEDEADPHGDRHADHQGWSGEDGLHGKHARQRAG